MSAQNNVRAVVKEEVRYLVLVAVLGGLVLHPPVDHHRDQVRFHGLGGLQGGGEAVRIQRGEGGKVVCVEEVDGVGLFLDGNAVGAVGVAQKGHGDAPHVRQDNVVIRLLLGAAGAHVGQSHLVQHVQRAGQAGVALVQTVVIGG